MASEKRKTSWRDVEFSGMRHARETVAAMLNDRAELDAALLAAIDMLQECMRNADNDTAAAIDAVLIECQKARSLNA